MVPMPIEVMGTVPKPAQKRTLVTIVTEEENYEKRSVGEGELYMVCTVQEVKQRVGIDNALIVR